MTDTPDAKRDLFRDRLNTVTDERIAEIEARLPLDNPASWKPEDAIQHVLAQLRAALGRVAELERAREVWSQSAVDMQARLTAATARAEAAEADLEQAVAIAAKELRLREAAEQREWEIRYSYTGILAENDVLRFQNNNLRAALTTEPTT